MEREDIVGKKFWGYTVISQNRQRPSLYLCRCECGHEAIIQRSELIRGTRKRCRHCSRQMRSRDLTGERFGMLTVIGKCETPEYYSDQQSTYYTVRCDCGIEFPCRGSELTRGIRYSCGCTRRAPKGGRKT